MSRRTERTSASARPGPGPAAAGPLVVKLGGSLLEDARLRAAALAAIASRFAAHGDVVLVHGGGKRIDAALARLGIPRRVHAGLRITDSDTLEAVVGALCGNVNKQLVRELAARGARCTGISGADGGTLRADRHPAVDGVDLGFVGRVTGADTGIVRALTGAGALPVVASIASGPAEAPLLNVNADAAASALAVALGARRLVFLTDVEGFMDGDGRVVRELDASRLEGLLAQGSAVTGGMLPKLRACLEAIRGGVAEVVIAGPRRHRAALRGGEGGTRLVAA
jgi:acetylglutamate kinase